MDGLTFLADVYDFPGCLGTLYEPVHEVSVEEDTKQKEQCNIPAEDQEAAETEKSSSCPEISPSKEGQIFKESIRS